MESQICYGHEKWTYCIVRQTLHDSPKLEFILNTYKISLCIQEWYKISSFWTINFKMRFFEIFFLFSPSWQLKPFHSKQIRDAVTRERSKLYAKFNNVQKQGLVHSEQKPDGRQISRNDEIKEIFDIPAQLLCHEFYQKHYGQGQTCIMQHVIQLLWTLRFEVQFQIEPLKSFSITTNSHYVANGAESAIYRCYTDDDIEVKARDHGTFFSSLRNKSLWIPFKIFLLKQLWKSFLFLIRWQKIGQNLKK